MKFGYRPYPLGLSRIARLLRRLVRATDGIETIEFALVSIVLFMFLLGVVEFGRAYWTQSELQYAAEATARCVTVNCCSVTPGSCNGYANNSCVHNFAQGKLLGMSVPSGSLSAVQVCPANCGNQVTLTYTFDFIAGALLIPLFPGGVVTLSSTACHQA